MKRKDKHQWMLARTHEFYFIKAKKEGYRARSAYKLLEINEKFKIIPAVGNVLDLGCAPGAWLQVLTKKSKANIFGIDLLDIEPISYVSFLKEDIFSNNIDIFLKDKKFSLILSDIAPNCSGIQELDHLRIMNIAQRIFELAYVYLKVGGSFCIKVFDGRDVSEFIKLMRTYFSFVKFFKPKSSSAESCEFYVVCMGFKGELFI